MPNRPQHYGGYSNHLSGLVGSRRSCWPRNSTNCSDNNRPLHRLGFRRSPGCGTLAYRDEAELGVRCFGSARYSQQCAPNRRIAVSRQGRDTGLERDRALVSCDDGGGLVARQAALGMTALFSAPPALPVAQDTAPVAECSVGDADLAAWARDHGHSRRRILAEPSGLQFAFYWRVSTEDHQDPVSSRQWQLDRASATISGAGRVVVEYCDVGLSRSVSPLLRPSMAALLSAVRAAASTLW